MSEQDHQTKLRELVAKSDNAMLTTLDADGQLVARPMALQQLDENDSLWFFTDDGEPKVNQIKADPRVGVTFTDHGWTSLQGTAEVVKDVEKQRELWNPAVAAWMQCEPDDPKVALIRVDATGGQFRTMLGAAPALFTLIAAKIKGEEPELGDQGKADLGSSPPKPGPRVARGAGLRLARPAASATRRPRTRAERPQASIRPTRMA